MVDNTSSKITISDQIRMLCTRLHISNAELARRLNVTPQSLNSKFKKNYFSIDDLEKIADATGTEFVRYFELGNGEKI